MKRTPVAITLTCTLLLIAFSVILPVHAQDGIDGALATLAAATRRADNYRYSRNATVQANIWKAAQKATATTQAINNEAMATRHSIVATTHAHNAEATRQTNAINATATTNVFESVATATASAHASIATATAETRAMIATQNAANTKRINNYIFAGLLIAFAAAVVSFSLRNLSETLSQDQQDTSVIDAEFTVTDTETHRVGRTFSVTQINDQTIIDAGLSWFDRMENRE